MNEQFIGTWQCDEGDSSARIVVVQRADGQLSVSGYDANDGEAFEISNVKTSAGSIEFDTLMPSTGYRTHLKLNIAEEGNLRVELTLVENWITCDE